MKEDKIEFPEMRENKFFDVSHVIYATHQRHNERVWLNLDIDEIIAQPSSSFFLTLKDKRALLPCT